MWIEVLQRNKKTLLCFRSSIKWAFSAVAVVCVLMTLLVYTPSVEDLRRPIAVSSHNSRTPFAWSGAAEPHVGHVKKHSNPNKKNTTNLPASKSRGKKTQAPRDVVEHTPLNKQNETRIQKKDAHINMDAETFSRRFTMQ